MPASIRRTLRASLFPAAVTAPAGRRHPRPTALDGRAPLAPTARPVPSGTASQVGRRLPGGAGRRQRALEAAVPEVLDVLRATLAAGVAPVRALQAAAEAAPSELAPLLAAAVRSTELGAGAGRALADAGRQARLTELALAGEALDLAEATGAPAGRVLAGVTAAAADRVRGRQARLAATAEARLSARVVACMAPGFLVVLAITTPADAAFLVRSPAGWATLAAAALFETLGSWWASRIIAGSTPSTSTHLPAPSPPAYPPPAYPPPAYPPPAYPPPAHPTSGRARSGRRRAGPGRRSLRPRRPGPGGRVLLAGGVMLAAALAFVAGPPLLLAGSLATVAALVAIRVTRSRGSARRRAALAEAAPAMIDLLGACLLAGLNPYLALQRVAERSPEALRAELSLVAADLHRGQMPAAALRAAAERTDLDELRAAASVLGAAERWGTPPAEALAARAESLRTRTRLRAEAEAGRAAVRLAFPLVFCFLPAFVALVVVPTIAGALQALVP
jgi:tight adherence protein C